MFFHEFINNKSVCIVGSAGYLSDHWLGEKIDSFDVVIRINRGHTVLNNKNKQQLGSKTSIIYTIADPLEQTKSELSSLFCEMLLHKTFIKTLPIYRNSLVGGNKELYEYLESAAPQLLIDTSTKTNIKLAKINPDNRKHPNTGVISILECLTCDPKNIYVCGFDFFSSINDSTYIEGYRDEMRARVGVGGHKPNDDMNLLKKELYKTKIPFELDSIMAAKLKI